MDHKTKIAKLTEIVEALQELFPKFDRMIITDLDDPDQIIFTSSEYAVRMAKEIGLDMEVVEALDLMDDEEQDADILDFGNVKKTDKETLQ